MLKFTEVITELNSCNSACAEITRDEVSKIFADRRATPKDNNLEENDSFVSGEIQYVFSKDMSTLDEVLVYPVYDNDGCLENGDFIDAPDSFWENEKAAREAIMDTIKA